MEATVRELLTAVQEDRKAKLDMGWVDSAFLHCDTLPKPQRLHLCPATPPAGMHCSLTGNADSLELESSCGPGPAVPAPWQVLTLARMASTWRRCCSTRMVCSVTRYLVLWRGHTLADDEWRLRRS